MFDLDTILLQEAHLPFGKGRVPVAASPSIQTIFYD
ncbi:hypothetical protein PF005_g15392 [Phytophthora fragariae]|uniref:Uncharacterized protein n=3 Tax=Phytophthora TaxID=4783 RepID=A0A6A3PHZ9_9STRA|nr:hypothetical protein PF003_g16833 [Phytophthora fragariae]KAE8951878.1 hypothetical protein PR001_g33542 [Phytophthora rubi]KAE8902852.1 hypothetical protein PF003_g13242 [Phytophthora fragariae]KAE8931012.1 hypothetical protein PF009_g18922 [Phytophthora fragariae]KAE8934569.1 hypothetical protein PF009_g15456 [Phytophthora fragariae]